MKNIDMKDLEIRYLRCNIRRMEETITDDEDEYLDVYPRLLELYKRTN